MVDGGGARGKGGTGTGGLSFVLAVTNALLTSHCGDLPRYVVHPSHQFISGLFGVPSLAIPLLLLTLHYRTLLYFEDICC